MSVRNTPFAEEAGGDFLIDEHIIDSIGFASFNVASDKLVNVSAIGDAGTKLSDCT